MTELEKKQVNCPYCYLGHPIKDNSCSTIAIEQNANILWFNSDKFIGEDEGDIVKAVLNENYQVKVDKG